MNRAVSQLEKQTFQLVIGNNTPTVHPVLGTFPAVGCIPLPIEPAAQTVTSDNAGTTAGLILIGTGTNWLDGTIVSDSSDKVEQGDFIANADGVLRRVLHVLSNTMLELEAKFPASLSATPLRIVRKNFYRSILAASTGTADAELNEQTFAVGGNMFDEGAPVSYDVSAADSEITFTLSV